MKGKIILLVTAIVAIGLTIAIYNSVVTEWTSNITLSLAVVCAAEFAVVCTMGLLPVMNYKNGSTGILINIYAALMVLWAIIGCEFDGNVFLTGLLIISAVMLVIIGASVMGSHESDRLNDTVEQQIDRKRSFATSPAANITSAITDTGTQENLTSMWLTMQATVDDYETKKRLRVLVERIQALPTNQFPNSVIETTMSQITAMCRALTNTDAHDRILGRINDKTKELTSYIKTL